MGSDIVASRNCRIGGHCGSVGHGDGLVAIRVVDDGDDDFNSGSDTAEGAHIPRIDDSVGIHLQGTTCT